MNTREHWATRDKRRKSQQAAVSHRLSLTGYVPAPVFHVMLTRLAPRRLDSDNLASSFKHVQDAVARFLGADDGRGLITWEYAQEKCATYAVRIEVTDLRRDLTYTVCVESADLRRSA